MNSPVYSFNGGEISRRLWGRTDMPRYLSSVDELTNTLTLPYGGITRRPGMEHIAVWNNASLRLIDFRYSAGTAFIIAFGDLKIRFYSNGTPVLSGGIPLELESPYPADDLADIRAEQILDAVYLTHPRYPQQRLFRVTDTNWTLTEMSISSYPFKDVNTTATTIRPSATTGNITLTASAATFDPTHVGSRWRIGHVRAVNAVNKVITSTGTSSSILVQGDYTFRTTGVWAAGLALESSSDNGATWVTLGSWIGTSDYNVEVNESSKEPRLLRANVTSFTSATGSPVVSIDSRNPMIYGTAVVTAFTSSTVVNATVEDAFHSTSATEAWAEGSWSDRSGYPRQVILHDGRLYFAGTVAEPLTYWGSAVDDFGMFGRFAGAPDLGIRRQLYSPTADQIQWLASRNGALIIGTAGDEWVVQYEGDPVNAIARRSSSYGSNAVGVVELNDSLLFVERRGRRVRDYIGLDTSNDDLARDPFSAGDLTLVAEHITREGITQMAVSKEPDPVLWCVVGGNLIGLNYDRTQSVMGWHRHTTEGTILSVAVIPGQVNDEIWLAVLRDGTTRIERLHPTTPDRALDNIPAECLYWDSGLLIVQSSSTTVTGLSHLNGKTVSVNVDGGSHPTRVVSGGSITLARAGTKIAVGLPFTSTMETLPLVAQSERGSSRHFIARINQVIIEVYNTFGLQYSDATREQWYECQSHIGSNDPNIPPPLQTGPLKLTVAGGHDRQPRLKFRQNNGLPGTMLCMTVNWDQTEAL
jgi:hypothetical protein